MKYIVKYNNFIVEGLTEPELNRILDKISSLGINSLTKEEKFKLDSFNGKYDDIKPTDHVTFDNDGNLLVNGKSYTQFKNEDPNSDESPKKEPQKKSDPKIEKNNYKRLKKNYSSEDYFTLVNDKDISVVLDRNMPNKRIYYIYFKKIKDVESKCITLKLVYYLNKRGFDNFKVYDNFNNPVDWNRIEIFLKEHGLTFGDFNNAWYYTEDNFNNNGYTRADD